VPAATIGDVNRTPTGKKREYRVAEALVEKETARRLRSLVLVVKALLAGVDDGLLSTHEALLPWTVLPSGETVAEWADPQLDDVYRHAQMPTMLSRLALGPK
jgi:hypothetical protein